MKKKKKNKQTQCTRTLENTMRIVLRGKFIAMIAYVKKKSER
jgi:hypothetical protein